MANIITGIRIVLSVALLFFPALSPAFLVIYAAGGLSDMIDGAVARRTGTVSEFGSRLDTFADIVFAAVCLIKLLPVLDVPVWLYVWVAVIAIIKLGSITAGYIRQKKLVSVHSALNKAAGLLLFVFPLTLAFVDVRYSATVVCMAATAAAIQEGLTVVGKISIPQFSFFLFPDISVTGLALQSRATRDAEQAVLMPGKLKYDKTD